MRWIILIALLSCFVKLTSPTSFLSNFVHRSTSICPQKPLSRVAALANAVFRKTNLAKEKGNCSTQVGNLVITPLGYSAITMLVILKMVTFAVCIATCFNKQQQKKKLLPKGEEDRDMVDIEKSDDNGNANANATPEKSRCCGCFGRKKKYKRKSMSNDRPYQPFQDEARHQCKQIWSYNMENDQKENESLEAIKLQNEKENDDEKEEDDDHIESRPSSAISLDRIEEGDVSENRAVRLSDRMSTVHGIPIQQNYERITPPEHRKSHTSSNEGSAEAGGGERDGSDNKNPFHYWLNNPDMMTSNKEFKKVWHEGRKNIKQVELTDLQRDLINIAAAEILELAAKQELKCDTPQCDDKIGMDYTMQEATNREHMIEDDVKVRKSDEYRRSERSEEVFADESSGGFRHRQQNRIQLKREEYEGMLEKGIDNLVHKVVYQFTEHHLAEERRKSLKGGAGESRERKPPKFEYTEQEQFELVPDGITNNCDGDVEPNFRMVNEHIQESSDAICFEMLSKNVEGDFNRAESSENFKDGTNNNDDVQNCISCESTTDILPERETSEEVKSFEGSQSISELAGTGVDELEKSYESSEEMNMTLDAFKFWQMNEVKNSLSEKMSNPNSVVDQRCNTCEDSLSCVLDSPESLLPSPCLQTPEDDGDDFYDTIIGKWRGLTLPKNVTIVENGEAIYNETSIDFLLKDDTDPCELRTRYSEKIRQGPVSTQRTMMLMNGKETIVTEQESRIVENVEVDSQASAAPKMPPYVPQDFCLDIIGDGRDDGGVEDCRSNSEKETVSFANEDGTQSTSWVSSGHWPLERPQTASLEWPNPQLSEFDHEELQRIRKKFEYKPD